MTGTAAASAAVTGRLIGPHLRGAMQRVARDLMNESRQMRSLTAGHCPADRRSTTGHSVGLNVRTFSALN